MLRRLLKMRYLSLGNCGSEEMVFKYDEEKVTWDKMGRTIEGDVVPLSKINEVGWCAQFKINRVLNGSLSDFEIYINSIKNVIFGCGLIWLGFCRHREMFFKYDPKAHTNIEENAQYISIMGEITDLDGLEREGCPAIFTGIKNWDKNCDGTWKCFELHLHPINVNEITVNNQGGCI